MSLAAFEELVADSFAVRSIVNQTKFNNGTTHQQKNTNDAAQVAQVVKQLKRKLDREKREVEQNSRINSLREERQKREQEAQRRLPQWLVSAQAESSISSQTSHIPWRPWSVEEQHHLSELLLSHGDEVCDCRKRRKLAATSSESLGCCFQRWAYTCQSLHRSSDDVEAQLLSWNGASAATGNPSKVASRPLPTSSDPNQWPSACWKLDMLSQLNPFMCSSTSLPPPATVLPMWPAEAVHDLMAAVQAQRVRLAESGGSPALSDSSWYRIADSLSFRPPPLDAQLVFSHVLASGGYEVPTPQRTQCEFYFPSQRLYRNQTKVPLNEVDEEENEADTGVEGLPEEADEEAASNQPIDGADDSDSGSAHSSRENATDETSSSSVSDAHRRKRRRSRGNNHPSSSLRSAIDQKRLLQKVRELGKRFR